MSSSSSRSSHRSGCTLGGASPPGNSSSVMRRDIVPQQGVIKGFDGSENDKHDLSSEHFSSSEDNLQSHAPCGSSSGASINLVGNSTLLLIAKRIELLMQRKMYGEDCGFPYSLDLANSVKQVLKEKIFPKMKVLCDTKPHYMAHDFLFLINQETFVMF